MATLRDDFILCCITLVMVAVLWVMSACIADGAGLSTPAAASFRISTQPDASGMSSHGSATGIDNRIAVTNKHVARVLRGRVTLKNHVTGESTGGYVFAIDRNADLALIWTDKPVSYVRAVSTGIAANLTAEKFGYGGGVGRLMRIRCKYLHGGGTVTLSTPSISGDSGGGVFQDGKLVAVLWGSEDTSGRNANATSVAANGPQLQRFVAEYDRQHRTGFLQRIFPDCPNGTCPNPYSQPQGGGGSVLPHREPVTPEDTQPETPAPTPAPEPAKPTPAPPGKDGADGRGIKTIRADKSGALVIVYTDGEEQTIPGFGFTLTLHDANGEQVDSEFVSSFGGTLKLQQKVSRAK